LSVSPRPQQQTTRQRTYDDIVVNRFRQVKLFPPQAVLVSSTAADCGADEAPEPVRPIFRSGVGTNARQIGIIGGMDNQTRIRSGRHAPEERDVSQSVAEPDGSHVIREELETRLRFETLIADLSSEFVSVPSEGVDHLIGDVQRRICQCLDIDLSGLWQWSGDSPGFLGLTHLYRSEEGPPTPDPMDAAEYFPWCLQHLLAGKIVAVPSVDAMPPEAARDREVFRHFFIKSTLVIPLAAGGGPLIGALGLNATKSERVWPETLVKRLRIIAEIFANAITRKRSDQVLRESEERLSLATAAAGLGVWVRDVARDEIWGTDQWRQMFGFPPEERIDYGAVIQRIHPQDREAVDRAVQQAIADRADITIEFRVVLPDGGERWIAVRGHARPGSEGSAAKVLGVSVDITDRKHAELALEERVRFEKVLADLSATFVNLPPGRFDETVDDSLKMLVKALGHDRSTLAEFRAEEESAAVLHSFTVPGCAPFVLREVPYDFLPWYLAQLQAGNPVWFERPEDLPPEAEKERQFCIEHGIKSHVAIPLKAGGTVLGMLNFSSFRQVGHWNQSIVTRMQMIGEVFANAFLHKRDQEAIQAALAENERLRERLELENVYLREQITLKHHHGRIIGKSQALAKALSQAERVAPADSPVLLLGETGTGKELLAQTIHELSARKDRPMVILNCASLPATLIESELFGREAGAYTGAASAQVGRFTVADGSTLFLDEIGEFPVGTAGQTAARPSGRPFRTARQSQECEGRRADHRGDQSGSGTGRAGQ
jgi:PAS domain S-box-containing protein